MPPVGVYFFDIVAFAQVRGHDDIDDGPDPAGEVGVVHVVFDGRGFGEGVAVLDRDFQPAIDGFFGVGQGLFEGVACGVAAGQVGYDDSIGVSFRALLKPGLILGKCLHHFAFFVVKGGMVGIRQ